MHISDPSGVALQVAAAPKGGKFTYALESRLVEYALYWRFGRKSHLTVPVSMETVVAVHVID